MAMKGLFCSNLDRKEEGYDLVKKGIRFDMKSHICWHVLGLLYRADKNFEEAIKCYGHALKYDKGNIQILRDLSVLQMQMRNYEGYVDSRHELVELRSQNRQYWIGLAIGYHMMGKLDLSVKVLNAYEDTLKDIPATPDFEHSEMLIYHNSILDEMGDAQVALDHLNAVEKHICDRTAIRERRAKYLLALGRLEEAEAGHRLLITQNPDNFAYFDGLRKSVGLGNQPSTVEEEAKLLQLFKSLQVEHPRSNAARRLPLNFTTGATFVEIADAYCRNMLRKGVPSLFVNIKPLYANKEKEQAMENLVLGYLDALTKSKGFDHSGAITEPPTALLWTLYFLAQHFDLKRETDKALGYINRAIEHTPTLVELHMTKGRILKHAGDYVAAMNCVNEARELDLQDRFINSKCTKYMLRADKIAEAEKTVVLFTRADLPSPLDDLVDMQAIWFSLECAESHIRQGQLGRALKRLHQIEKHFIDFTDDQIDFHSYSLRKMTLKAYVSLLKFEDRLRNHAYYTRAVQGAVKSYVTLFDKPEGADTPEMEGMTEAEKKKFRNKQRKAELKAQKEQEEKKALADQELLKKGGKIDEDPEGLKYTKMEDPLGEALKLLRPLQDLAPNRIDTHLMAFELYIRKKKYLLALGALLKSIKIDAHHATLHEQLVRFRLAVEAAGSEIKANTKKVLDQHWETLYHSQDLKTFVAAFAQEQVEGSNAGLVDGLIAAAMAASLTEKDIAQAEKLLLLVGTDRFAGSRTLDNSKLVLKTLRSMRSSRAQEFKSMAHTWYPLADAFKP
ncbi:N-alpha-acetyltransferase 15, NatA auxiliary subunit [Podila epigama]|nr:N-alpha-acetyltransferase 15, NatA auxiliary subunit [Podila epigama]